MEYSIKSTNPNLQCKYCNKFNAFDIETLDSKPLGLICIDCILDPQSIFKKGQKRTRCWHENEIENYLPEIEINDEN
jgi:hypothetical protein